MRKLLGHLNLEVLLCEFLRNAHLELDEGLQRPHQQDSILSSCCPAALNNILTYLTSHGSSVPQLPRFLRRPFPAVFASSHSGQPPVLIRLRHASSHIQHRRHSPDRTPRPSKPLSPTKSSSVPAVGSQGVIQKSRTPCSQVL